MGRLLIFAIIIWIAYFVAKSIWKSLTSASDSETRTREPAADTDLIRDPQCGAYFMKSKGVKGIVEGRVIHFCSEECYDNYLKRLRGER
jgi:YHS domain-containing protein